MSAIIVLAAILAYLIIGAVVFRVTLPYRWRQAYAAYPKVEPTYHDTLGVTPYSEHARERADERRRVRVINSSCAALFGWPVWVPLALAAHTIDQADPDPLAPWEITAMQDRITELEKELEADA